MKKNMKTKITYLFCILYVFVGLLSFNSCSEDYEYDSNYSAFDNLTIKIALVENDTLYVNVINQLSITMLLDPDTIEIDKKGFIYELSDTLIAKITSDGKIEPEKPGSAQLTVKFRGNHDIMAKCIVKITPLLITDLVMPENTLVIKEGQSDSIPRHISVTPGNASYQTFTYEPEDLTIVSVNEKGIVTALKEGVTNIIVSTIPGAAEGIISKPFPIKVLAEVKVSDIQLSALDGKTVGVGQYFDLAKHAVALPDNADDPTLSYSITEGNGSVVELNDGILKTIGTGNAKITVTANDGSGVSKVLSLTVDGRAEFERATWTVKTSIFYENKGVSYVIDGSTGKPEHILDGDATTFLSLVKPGKTYDNYTTPAGYDLNFVVDMGVKQKFNTLYWCHRGGNANNYLRTWGISMYGSNDGENYTPIAVLDLPYADYNPFSLPIPESEYRYVKVKYEKWSDNSGGSTSGGTMQVGEFNLGFN